MYFPVLSTQTVMTAVTLTGYLVGGTELILPSLIALYGPLEFAAYGGQAYLAYRHEIAKDDYTLENSGNGTSNSTNQISGGRML